MLRSGIGYRVVAKQTRSSTLWACRLTQFSYDENRAPINNPRLGHTHVSPQLRRHFLGIMMVRCYCCVTLEETLLPHRIPIHVHIAYDCRYHRGLNSRHTLRQAHTPAIQHPFHYPAHLTFSVSHMHRPRAWPPPPHVRKPKTRRAVKYPSKINHGTRFVPHRAKRPETSEVAPSIVWLAIRATPTNATPYRSVLASRPDRTLPTHGASWIIGM